MAKICVFCSSSDNQPEKYRAEARLIGKLLAKKNHELIYGGSHKGLMGDMAKEFLKYSNKITEIIPKIWEDISTKNGNIILTEDIEERIRHMLKLADGFIALPGGIGTIQEIIAVLVHGSLGITKKPIAVVNIGKVFDHYFNLLAELHRQNLIKTEILNHSYIAKNSKDALNYLEKNV